MSMNYGASLGLEPGSWQEAVYDIIVGTVVGGAHIFYFVKRWYQDLIRRPLSRLWKAIATAIPEDQLNEQENNNNNNKDNTTSKGELKVIGAGFGRTGTYSLTLALEELGFPTLHTQHLYENEDIFKMWTDRIFQPSLEKGKAELGTPDFDSITSRGYQATMDFPMALYVDQILERYPDCKFILTVRENSQVWFRSWDTLTKSITAPTHFGGYFITGVRQYSIYLRWLFAIVNQDDSFLTSSRPKMTQYKDAAIDSYETHNRRVREIVPPAQLLEYNVKEGWEPLCQFLEIAPHACPTYPFPKTNSARSVQVQAVSAAATPLFLVLLVVFFFFTVIFQRVTGSQTVLGWVQYRLEQLVPSLVRKLVVWASRTSTTDKERQEEQQQLQQQQKLQQKHHHLVETKKVMKKKMLSYPKPKAL